MPIRYDGTNIYHQNKTDYDAYNAYMREQRQMSDDAINEQRRNESKRSWEQWMQWCPQDFRDASIESIRSHDPEVSDALEKAVKVSKESHVPSSVILGSYSYNNPYYKPGSDKPSEQRKLIAKGKTWAMYAYVSALYAAGVIDDPIHQVVLITEAMMLDKLTSWQNDGWLDTVFTPDTKLVIIDNINSGAGEMKRAKYGTDAWNRFSEEANKHDGIGFVLSFSGDFNDMGLMPVKQIGFKIVRGKAVKAVLKKGVEGKY